MEKKEELFKEMLRRPGYYVRSWGRVMSFKRESPKFLSVHVNWLGFPEVQVFFNGRGKFLNIAREVLAAFKGYPADPWLCVAKHKNGDLLDCRLDNLEWVICETDSTYDPRKSHRRGVLKPDHTKGKMSVAKYNQSRETIEKQKRTKKRNFEERKRFKEMMETYSAQNIFRNGE